MVSAPPTTNLLVFQIKIRLHVLHTIFCTSNTERVVNIEGGHWRLRHEAGRFKEEFSALGSMLV